jgi:nucleoside-diphosphate-sugar epimerase
LNILVTGGAGYVGSVVIPELIKQGHEIKCLDRFFFGREYLSKPEFENKIQLIQDDIRWFNPKILENVDVVMDLAALSNDPVGDLDPSKTFDINYLGRSRVARLSKQAGVKKYILASSASIYGQQENTVDETSNVNPLTAYSKANHMAEMDNLSLNDDKFSVTALRFSSIYGLSPRMRFDLAVNGMALELFKTAKILVRGKSNTRPMLHLKDTARAYESVINAPNEKIAGQIFNVGSDEQNFQMDNLAQEVGNSIGKEFVLELKDTTDHRSYTASFKKIKKTLGFETKFTVKDGATEIYNALETGELTDSKKTITVEWYKYLQSAHMISKQVSLRDIII